MFADLRSLPNFFLTTFSHRLRSSNNDVLQHNRRQRALSTTPTGNQRPPMLMDAHLYHLIRNTIPPGNCHLLTLIPSSKTRNPRKSRIWPRMFGPDLKWPSHQTRVYVPCPLLEYIRVVVRGSQGSRRLASKVPHLGFLDAICTVGQRIRQHHPLGGVGSNAIAHQRPPETL
jgi:hypothetical protein